ncbi:MAG TPA: BatA domain-containing protein [Gemmatimonadaceae bacterium]|jgi:hypothetical protein|nr:BatA domain-containing protein [Gemmatimonadaceae bacterium]
MGLLSPWFLVGLGALAAPILVHLIQKERKDAIPFPSLMFLEHVPYQSVRRQQIRNWLLFLLRCLAMILLVLAFARPFFASRNASAASVLPDGGRDIVIALDRSYSMGYGDRWKRAVTAAKDVVDHMSSADRAAVVYFSGTAWAASDLTNDKSALRSAIDSVHPTAGITRYDAAFRFVQQVFGDSARPRREVALISDYHRAGWSDRALPPLPAGTRLTQINVGDTATSNVLVTLVDVHSDTSAGRERVNIEAHLANRSAKPIQKHPVTFELNGRPMQTRLVDCPANGATTVTFDPVPTPEGLSRGLVHSGTDALEADNRFYFMVEHQPSLPVLLVEPSDADPKTGMFLSLALGIGQRLSFRVKTVKADQLTADALHGTSFVILNGVAAPGGDVGRRLVDYVKGGGGLLVVLGNRSHPSDWPALADQLLPHLATPAIDRTTDRGATLGYLDRSHSVFDVFDSPHSGDFSTARFSRYWAIKPAAGDRQLARFDDGHVALLERRVGAGRVLIWTSDMDGAWNDFPLQPVFLPLVQQVAKYAAGYHNDSGSETVGNVISLPALFGENTAHADSIVTPTANDEAQYVAISPSGVQTRFTTSSSAPTASIELTEQGFYDIKRAGGAGDSARTVAVNVDLAESDLTPLDTSLLAVAVAPRVPVGGQAAAAGEIMPSDLEHRQGIWWYLLAAALLLLGIETLLSNRLSRALR